MKVAYFSPFPPKQTGIAAYSRALVDAMRGRASVTAFDHMNPDLLAADADAVDFGVTPEMLARLHEWDTTIFNLGNNPYYHLGILEACFKWQGLLLLHDSVLYYLFAGLSPGHFYKQFCLNYGADRVGEIAQIKNDSVDGNLLRYRFPERYPFLRTVAEKAKAVIVHSHFAAGLVRSAAPDAAIHVMPMLALVPEKSTPREDRAAELRASVLKRRDQVLLGTFGFIGPTKRMGAVCQSLAALKDRIDFHFIIVGDGPDPLPEFQAAGLSDCVSWHRYVADLDFDAWIAAADIVLNLRYPSMGESSATLIRAMGMAKACIVTNHGSFAEFPNETVLKIPFAEGESSALELAILDLVANTNDLREKIGDHARQHLRAAHSAGEVARRLLEIAQKHIEQDAHRIIQGTRSEKPASRVIRKLIETTLRESLPAHLRAGAEPDTSCPPPTISLGVSHDEVIWAYRILLQRDPEPDRELPSMMRNVSDVGHLRKIILESEEFRANRLSR